MRRELMFKEFRALQNINLEVKRGDVFGLLGTNGSGKSTLMKIIAGVLEPSKGTCTVNGNIAPLIELGAGFDMDLTARENVYLNGALLGYSKQFIDGHFDEIIDFAEVHDFLDMPLKNYSSGMVSRIAFAIATVIVPEILLVDEVLSVGDFMFQKKCEKRIQDLIENHGVTVVIVSHSNDQIARLCNKAVWIEKGHMRMSGSAQDVCRIYGALGGRSGSEESEHRIFEILRSAPETFDAPCEILFNKSAADLANGLAARRLLSAPTKTAIIASEASHINAAFGSSLAGALDAVLLTSPHTSLSPNAMATLLKQRPDTVYIINCGQASDGLVEEVSAFEWSPTVIDLSKPGLSPVYYSLYLFDYGHEHNLWSDTAYMVDFDNFPETSAISPELYACSSPLLCTWISRPECDSQRMAKEHEKLRLANIKNIGIVGNGVTSEIIDHYGESLNVFPLGRGEQSMSHRSMEIAKHLFDRLSAEKLEGEKLNIVFASADPNQLLHLCTICNKTQRDTVLLLIDAYDMDDMMNVFDYLSSIKANIGSITFFGSENCISQEDILLLRSALS